MTGICPVCGGRDIHRSRLRNWMERVRNRLTARVPFRCHDCDWRGWSDDLAPRRPDDAAHRIPRRVVSDDEIDQLDDGAPGSLT